MVALYLGDCIFAAKLVNNKATINKLQSQILKKTGIETNITGLNLKISPKLNFALEC